MPADSSGFLLVTKMLLKVYGTTPENCKRCKDLARLITDCKRKVDMRLPELRDEIMEDKKAFARGILELQDATGFHREILRMCKGRLKWVAPPPKSAMGTQATIPDMFSSAARGSRSPSL